MKRREILVGVLDYRWSERNWLEWVLMGCDGLQFSLFWESFRLCFRQTRAARPRFACNQADAKPSLVVVTVHVRDFGGTGGVCWIRVSTITGLLAD